MRVKPMKIETERLELLVSEDKRDLKNYISHVKEAEEFFFLCGRNYSQELEEAISLENPSVFLLFRVFKRVWNNDRLCWNLVRGR